MNASASSAAASSAASGSGSDDAPRRKQRSDHRYRKKQLLAKDLLPVDSAVDTSSAAAAGGQDEPVETSALLLMLPSECLVEVLANLDIHELLDVAWTCKRLREAACDEALWSYTRFSVQDWQTVLQRHFVPDHKTLKKDHTGIWTRCECSLTKVCRAASILLIPKTDPRRGAMATCPPTQDSQRTPPPSPSPSPPSSPSPLPPPPPLPRPFWAAVPQASLMCRVVDLDYVDKGEGVCYRLLRSVSCLQQLHHPNIVPLVLINLEPRHNKLRLFYEDVGRALEDQIQTHGKLSMPQAKEVLRQVLTALVPLASILATPQHARAHHGAVSSQVLTALAHCHCQGITHRNLKPKYVLLRPSPHNAGHWAVKLSDFNSVRWLGIQRLGNDEPLYGAKEVSGACSPTVVTQVRGRPSHPIPSRPCPSPAA